MQTSPDTDAALNGALVEFLQSPRVEDVFVLPFLLEAPWQDGTDWLSLTAAYRFVRRGRGAGIQAFVTDTPLDPAPLPGEDAGAWFARRSRDTGAAAVDFARPWRLETVSVAKPWGRETWYTGIERRGVSRVAGEHGATPLPWLLAAAPERTCRSHDIVLLKTLDPLPDPVWGDLYFELHEHKREVYVVTHVDREAWPDGAGAIRYGMNAEVRGQYGDDAAFRRDYRAAVGAYEAVRRRIDELLDVRRRDAGIALDAPLAPAVQQQMLADLDPALVAEERDRRLAMERFTALAPLSVGDVVSVPSFVPHALQHGVRVVEFQTPVFERYIVSFAQKVLTQSHWDTAAAVDAMRLEVPPAAAFERLEPDGNARVERIVDFDAFSVWRAEIPADGELRLPAELPYAIVIAVTGGIVLGDLALDAEEACLLTGAALATAIRNRDDAARWCLIAGPGL